MVAKALLFAGKAPLMGLGAVAVSGGIYLAATADRTVVEKAPPISGAARSASGTAGAADAGARLPFEKMTSSLQVAPLPRQPMQFASLATIVPEEDAETAKTFANTAACPAGTYRQPEYLDAMLYAAHERDDVEALRKARTRIEQANDAAALDPTQREYEASLAALENRFGTRDATAFAVANGARGDVVAVNGICWTEAGTAPAGSPSGAEMAQGSGVGAGGGGGGGSIGPIAGVGAAVVALGAVAAGGGGGGGGGEKKTPPPEPPVSR